MAARVPDILVVRFKPHHTVPPTGRQPWCVAAPALSAGEGNVEVRYGGPDNVLFDISQTGWVGTPTNKVRG